MFVESCGENAVPQELGCGWQQFGGSWKDTIFISTMSQPMQIPITFFFTWCCTI
jgi:hypothetical protein